MHRYAELHTTSNYTFLTGASLPEELVEHAAALGHEAIAVTDHQTLGGIVRAHVTAKDVGIQLVVGCRLSFTTLHPDHDEHGDGPAILVYPTDAASYGRLCRLLTMGKRAAPKGECRLALHDLVELQEGLLAVIVPAARIDQALLEITQGLRRVFDDDRLSLAAARRFGEDDRSRLRQLALLSEHTGVPLVATNDVHYHHPERRPLQDVLTCIRHGCSIEQAGTLLHPHAERHLKHAAEMHRLFADHPDALRRTIDLVQRTRGFTLDQLRYQYPDEVCPPGRTPLRHLAELAHRGAEARYPQGVPSKVHARLDHELRLIDELHYAPYFLTVHDLVMFARERGILCQGRGAAANSAVCFCLGVTSVDPDRIELLFERFVSKERNEPPDIDIDFEHERREEVLQYVYGKYGRDRAAITAEIISYRGRSAIRDVGKAMGLSLDCVDRLAKDVDWWSEGVESANRIRSAGLDPRQPVIAHVLKLTREIQGFPRHRSQHVGGFVITRGPLCEMVPVENAAMPDRTIVEWDKDDLDAMGMLKVDCLGLGMLTCIRRSFEFIERHHARTLTLATIPPEDPDVYDMICRADTVGVFQIESRAQMSMLPRLRPRSFYDLVIEVAIVRPGPIQGQMVHPYLRRRTGEEPVHHPTPEVERVLGRTLGVPLFQEQAMALAIEAAGFTAGEADALRRAMAAWKRKGDRLLRFESRFVGGMLARGYDRAYAQRCFEQLKGFSEYGFPESHAASFALLVYASSWLKHHHPAVFAAALINSQPMGFYAPAQIVRDAQAHGVEVRPVDVNHSAWDCTLERIDDGAIDAGCGAETNAIDEPALPRAVSDAHRVALRLGMRLVKGLPQRDAEAIAAAVERQGPVHSVERLHRTSGVSARTLRRLAAADAFGSMGLDRQCALWQVQALRDIAAPILENAHAAPPIESIPRAAVPGLGARTDPPSPLPPVPLSHRVVLDYETIGLSLKAHPLSFLRDELEARGITRAGELADVERWPHGRAVSVAGVVLVRQRPATAAGVIFMTIEDETGVANLILRPKIYDRHRRAARHGRIIAAHGTLERQGAVVHLLIRSVEAMDDRFADLLVRSRDFH